MNTRTHYDVIIIGAGMSGLAAGIRLAHFGRKVCIFERHNAPGGLNSFYSIGGRKFDVGLHAMTNFVRPGVKGTPLTKLLRQLRIDREEFALCEQKRSRIAFGPRGETSLSFTNDFAVFESEVARLFPAQIDGFRRLVAHVRCYDDVSLDAPVESARAVVRRHVTDPLLEDMLFCPVMYYGSATERDMEFGQFVIMFKALFLEGFSRPFEGVRTIIRVLLEKYRAAGGVRRMKCGVRNIVARRGRVASLILDDGSEVTAGHVISSIGAVETERLLRAEAADAGSTAPAGESQISDLKFQSSAGASASAPSESQISNLRFQIPAGNAGPGPIESEISNLKSKISPGRLSFVETISVLNCQPAELGWGEDTIIFFNDSPHFDYARPADPVDPRSGVICIPNNFEFGAGRRLSEGIVRVTCLANYRDWAELPSEPYRAEKQRWFGIIQESARRFLPPLASPDAMTRATVFTDMFTPRTITKFTGHIGGAVYGAPIKNRQGRTAVENLYLCGTDQGFLGIVGAMLSGISMANYHILRKGPDGGAGG